MKRTTAPARLLKHTRLLARGSVRGQNLRNSPEPYPYFLKG